MGENSAIAWTDHTFNAWWGCSRVSPGCEHCYAETFSARIGHGKRLPTIWGVDGERKPMSDAYWRAPLKWNRDAERAGKRARVFCSSMADIFEIVPARNNRAERVMDAARARLWELVAATPWLDWLLLTKRPENVHMLAPWQAIIDEEGRHDGRPEWPANVWIGTTVEDQKRAEERIPWLIEIPARVRFVSVEPQLGPVDLENVVPYYVRDRRDPSPFAPSVKIDALRGHVKGPDDMLDHRVDWVIVGGESGNGARPFALEWAERMREACHRARVPFFMKQLGAYTVSEGRTTPYDPVIHAKPREAYADHLAPNGEVWAWRMGLKDRKGGDPAEWPDELRVQQFPEVRP